MAKIICVFGDSIAYGAWDEEKGGWVNRLRLFLDSNLISNKFSSAWTFVYNLGIESNTSENLLERFENEAKERFWNKSGNKNYKKDNILIFEIGKNDSIYKGAKDNAWVKIDQFEKNLNELIKKSKKFTNKIIFIGLANIDESKTIFYNKPEENYCNENIEKYNLIVKKVCRENKVDFIETMNILNKEDLEDGLHPNSQGHQKIFKKIKDFLLKNNLIER